MRIDLNKLLRLNIRGKLAIAFAGFSLLPVLIVGVLGIQSKVQSLRQVAIENLTHDVSTTKERLGAFVGGLDENVDLLSTSPPFTDFLDALASSDRQSIALALDKVSLEFLRYAGRKPIFYQVKFIDRNDDTAIGIERNGDKYRKLSDQELNQGGTRFYSLLASQTSPNQARFVPVELLSRDSGKLFPGISCIYPVFRQRFEGVLVLQIYAHDFFKLLEDGVPRGAPGVVMLVNSDGFYLYHTEKKRDWNQLLATQKVANLKSEYGVEAARQLLNSSSLAILELKNELLVHVPLFSDSTGFVDQYTLIKSVKRELVFEPAEMMKRFLLGLLVFFLLLSLFLAYTATRQFTNPIRRLHQEAEVIAQGNYHARVDVRTYDEIEDLAEQFNRMATSLEQRDAKIASHQKVLEETVLVRTQQLRDEKDKLQAILDNVPSGFLLLDRNYKILSASAAMKAIAGHPVKELLGRTCVEAMGEQSLCADCPTSLVFETGRMQTTMTRRVRQDGEETYLEHTSVPLTKDGNVLHVLEIITDVTKRKQLQDQLVRSERLAATGEIAAVIAHEMRNSLTSTRMILQLLKEDETSGPPDQESLDVALDSLTRMERVVSDLLQLARPAKLEKSHENMNDILRDAVEFAQPQITHQGITVEMELLDDLPKLQLDREQLREAFVNLILNASQAMDHDGRIEISTKVVKLPRRLRDLGEVRVVSGEKVTLGVQEVVLAKGEPVIRVDVRDSGCGVNKAHLQRIFDPFFTTKTNGTGLGLSFVKRVVNEHGGVLAARSKEGQGSCFTIMIPEG